jgi:hypothetical protein
MKSITVWHILAANGLVAIIVSLVSRRQRDLLFGAFGIATIVLPVAFAYFAGRLSAMEALFPCAGVLLLAADLQGRLPGLTPVRQRLGLERRRDRE